ncbi:hypothetical protein GCM10020358_73080 [Amorphoplanes nipponensis]
MRILWSTSGISGAGASRSKQAGSSGLWLPRERRPWEASSEREFSEAPRSGRRAERNEGGPSGTRAERNEGRAERGPSGTRTRQNGKQDQAEVEVSRAEAGLEEKAGRPERKQTRRKSGRAERRPGKRRAGGPEQSAAE